MGHSHHQKLAQRRPGGNEESDKQLATIDERLIEALRQDFSPEEIAEEAYMENELCSLLLCNADEAKSILQAVRASLSESGFEDKKLVLSK